MHTEYAVETVNGPQNPKYLLSGTLPNNFADLHTISYRLKILREERKITAHAKV